MYTSLSSSRGEYVPNQRESPLFPWLTSNTNIVYIYCENKLDIANICLLRNG